VCLPDGAPREGQGGAGLEHGRSPLGRGCGGLCILSDAKLCLGSGGRGCGGADGANSADGVNGANGNGSRSGADIADGASGAAAGNECGSGRAAICGSGLCAKAYFAPGAGHGAAALECGDYKLLAGSFVKRLADDAGYDMNIRRGMEEERLAAEADEKSIREQMDDSIDAFLLRKWRNYSLGEFLEAFPQIDRNPSRVEIQTLIYMFCNYRLNITLEHFEGRFLLAHNMINRYLRLYFGCSYTNLLYMIRNAHSKLLLMIPMLRIGEIAALVGYKSNFHFSLCFKRLEGVSPKEYRESHVKQRLGAIIAGQ
jgi:AraC-like DNA-binding protein